MRRLLFIIPVLLCAYISYAQNNSGRGFNFQAVARNAEGIIRAKETVKLQFSFLPGSSTAASTYTETFTTTTDVYGTFSVMIGSGTPDKIKFNELNFVQNNYWLKIEIWDNNGWQPISNQTLLSVPYSESAYKAGNGNPIGTIIPFAGTVLPENWLWCDGSALSRTAYPELYAVLKTTNWGSGDGNTTFNLPNLFPIIDSNNNSKVNYIILATNPAIVTKQDNTDPYIEISPSTGVLVNCWDGSLIIDVSSNVSWTAASSNTAFCNVTPTSKTNNGTVTVNYTENPANTTRNAIITISGNGVTKTLNITQNANSFITDIISNYEFSGNGNDNVSGYNATPYNITYTVDRMGNINNAAYFNGSNAYYEVSNPDGFDIGANSSKTYNIWTNAQTEGLLYKYNATSVTIALTYMPNNLNFTLRNSLNQEVFINIPKPAAGYHMYTCVKTSQSMKLYIDGALKGEIAYSYTDCICQHSIPIRFGAWKSYDNVWHFTQGAFDEIKVWNKALSDNEIQLLYNKPY